MKEGCKYVFVSEIEPLCSSVSLAVVLIDSFDWSVVFFLETPPKILFIIFLYVWWYFVFLKQ